MESKISDIVSAVFLCVVVIGTIFYTWITRRPDVLIGMFLGISLVVYLLIRGIGKEFDLRRQHDNEPNNTKLA